MIDHEEFCDLVRREASLRAMLDAAIESYLNLETKPSSNGSTSSLTARVRGLHRRLTFARRAEDLLTMYGRATGRIHPPSDLEQMSAIVAAKAMRQTQPSAQGAPTITSTNASR